MLYEVITSFNAGANDLPSPVICWFNPIVVDEDEQTIPFFQNIGTQRPKILIGRLLVSQAQFFQFIDGNSGFIDELFSGYFSGLESMPNSEYGSNMLSSD